MASAVKRSSALRTSSSKQLVGSGVGVGVKLTVAWKHEHALLTLGVENSLTYTGKAVDAPAGKARNPGQNAIASAVNLSRARSTLSAKQIVGRGASDVVVGFVTRTALVGVDVGELPVPAVTVAWKQEHALLTLGVENSLTYVGKTVEDPAGSAKKPGQNVIASLVNLSSARRTLSAKH